MVAHSDPRKVTQIASMNILYTGTEGVNLYFGNCLRHPIKMKARKNKTGKASHISFFALLLQIALF